LSIIGTWLTRGVVGVTALAAAVAGWIYLGLPVPASVQYVQDKVEHALKAYSGRIDNIEAVGLQNRLETLKQNQQGVEREKFDLQLKSQSIKDPNARDIIERRMRAIESDSKSIADSISETNSSLKGIKAPK
jgi:predicted  nucleic acid-binding Zn-ribbon protein